jgi:16S rRNA (guanine966-N2)-methyltransferase
VTRIIGGSAGGRRLTTPRGVTTRPTSDRVREALFSAVESWCGSLRGLRFLDLYAGSGAVGLEAWSRGAGVVTLVESDRRTAALIADNARTLGFDKAHVVTASVAPTLGRPPAAPYDVVFLDPPYPLDDAAVSGDLALLQTNGWLVPGGLVVAERSSRSPEPTWPESFANQRSKRYGETTLWYAESGSAKR